MTNSHQDRSGRAPRVSRRAILSVALLVAGLSPSVALAERTWTPEPASVPPCAGHSDLELGCAAVACIGYVERDEWASEVQIRYRLPPPPQGGPWLLEYVAIFIAGATPHRVRVRSGSVLGEPPGPLLADQWEFIPAYASWPPNGWTYVELRPDSPLPAYLQASGGELLTIGLELQPGDALGLIRPGQFAEAWSFHEADWIEDSPLGPAIRLGLTDLGLSDTQEATWGRVKGLFK